MIESRRAGSKKYMNRRGLLGGLLALAGGYGPPGKAAAARKFEMWQCMKWNGLPSSFSGCGFRNMTIFYESALVTGDQPDYRKIDKAVAAIRRARPPIVTLDIERWDPSTASGRDRLIRVIEYVRARVPSTVELGYWGIMPNYAYDDYRAGGSRLRRQRSLNKAMRPLAARTDWIMPSLYTYEGNRARWAQFADIVLEEAHDYGKPVMPWLWMQFMGDSPYRSIRHDLIPGEFFRSELDKVRVKADSACLWGTRVSQGGGPIKRLRWQENAPWWRETKSFMHALGRSTNSCKLR
jgi:hypothetical protein